MHQFKGSNRRQRYGEMSTAEGSGGCRRGAAACVFTRGGAFKRSYSEFVFRTRIQDSYSKFVSRIRIQGSYPEFVYRVHIHDSYPGFVSKVLILARIQESYQEFASEPGLFTELDSELGLFKRVLGICEWIRITDVSWIRIITSYHGIVLCIRFMDSYPTDLYHGIALILLRCFAEVIVFICMYRF